MKLFILAAVVVSASATFIQGIRYYGAPGTQFSQNVPLILQRMGSYDLTSTVADLKVKVGMATSIGATGKFAFNTAGIAKQLTQAELNRMRQQLQQQAQTQENTLQQHGFQRLRRAADPTGPQFDFGDYKLVFFVQDVSP